MFARICIDDCLWKVTQETGDMVAFNRKRVAQGQKSKKAFKK